jgi:hypothetical protein
VSRSAGHDAIIDMRAGIAVGEDEDCIT